MVSASDDDENEQLAALNDERDRAEVRDRFNRELIDLELRVLAARMREQTNKEK